MLLQTLPRTLACLFLAICPSIATASLLFDFNSASPMQSLPLDQTVGGVTAHLSATDQGFSIQPYGTLGIAPAGMDGNYISPNSVFKSDLLVSFDTPISDFSILYSPHELATDSSCTMRVTAFLGAAQISTSTYRIPDNLAGTWPTGALAIASAQPFDNVVVHYESPPPTGGDYGVIFIADNMTITPAPDPASISLLTLGALFALPRRPRPRQRRSGMLV